LPRFSRYDWSRESTVTRSGVFPSTPRNGSLPSFSIRAGASMAVNCRGWRPGVTSSQRIGIETGTPGNGLAENGATRSFPRPFWR
jgi:hypothetical protein